jgi:hypothetical protein
MFCWLLLAYPTDLQERRICLNIIKSIRLENEVTIYAYIFGPNNNSVVQRFKIDVEGWTELNSFHVITEKQKYKKYLTTLADDVVNWFVKYGIKVNGVIYYGHSSGIILGLWHGQKILATVTDFVQTVLMPLQPNIMIFDSCYMATLSALFELSTVKSLRYVLASSYYHPGFSILQTKAFGKIKTTEDVKHLQEITCEFQALRGPRYRCLLLLDVQKIPALVKRVRLAAKNNELIFDKNSVVNKKEDLYDLYSSACEEGLKKQIQQVSQNTCNINNCHKIKGVTIDIELPALHLKIYKKMLWFQTMKNVMYK